MTPGSKLHLELPLLLPDLPDARDRCVSALIQTLSGRSGITDAHVVDEAATPAELCIHYDPELISLERVRELAASVGAEITSRVGHLIVQSIDTFHARAASSLGAKLRALDGVFEAEVAGSGVVRIEFDRQRISKSALREQVRASGARLASEPLGLPAASQAPTEVHADDHDHAHEHGGPFGEQSELAFALICGALLATGWILSRWVHTHAWVPIACYGVAYVFGGYFTLREAIDNLRARRFEIDTLMLVAAVGAASLGQWAEGALLLFLFSLGHSLEHYAMGRARRAIEALAELAPERALVRRGEATLDIAVADLVVGDVVIVRPNERMPADGFLTLGASSVNQAPVTGESVPVDKRAVEDAKAALDQFDRLGPEYRVFAGTINGAGAIEIMVARLASQSTMARVVRMVAEAETQRSPAQNFTERFEHYFVPAALVLVGALMFAWVVVDEPFSASFYRAMAVLVAASPCALAISVPSAVLSGIARAARGGVLIKGGGPLENLGTLTAIAFDKTGTLTEGRPRLTDVVVAEGVTESELLGLALAVEERSDHPLAGAVVAGARERLGSAMSLPAVSGIESITGRGMKAQLGDKVVHIGKPVLFTEIGGTLPPSELVTATDRLVGTGRTTMIVRLGERYLGVLGLMDTPRPGNAEVMRSLRALGIARLVMLSGDHQLVADSVAREVGLTEARGDLMPQDKVEAIKQLRASAGKVAMVGDGVNDAPAMANATVGIAMGAAGSDVALETADVALMADDLGQLPFAVGLSRQASRIIRQNLWISLGVVAVLIPATLLGLNIGTAVIFHEGSTVLVVVNALRLLAYDTQLGRVSRPVTKTSATS